MRRWVTGVSVAVMVLCILGFVGSLVAAGFGGDYDKYGSVPIPDTGSVSLPAGEVDIFFVAYTPTSGDGPVTIPDLKFTLGYPDGYRAPVIKEDGGTPTTVNTKEHVRIWRLTVRTAGTYTVTTDGGVGAFIDPRLSFGTGTEFPGWLPVAFGILFLVALGGIIVGQRLGDDHAASVLPAPVYAPEQVRAGVVAPGDGGLDPELRQLMAEEEAERSRGGAAPPPVPTSVGAPSADTPEQSMARLQQLDQLQQLHAAGTLSDSEYDAARRRLGSG